MNQFAELTRSEPPWPWLAAMRALAVGIATAALALLAAGCGGGSGSHVAELGSTPAQTNATPFVSTNPAASSGEVEGGLAFSRCMRSHGVVSFPDPTSGGTIPKVALQQLGVSDTRFEAAQVACQHLLPQRGGGPTAAELRQNRAQALRFSQCMRGHGVTGFPDPGEDGRIPDPATVGVNQGSPKFERANQACGAFRPPYVPSNAAYNAYAQSHGS